jgi:hypothetical protein
MARYLLKAVMRITTAEVVGAHDDVADGIVRAATSMIEDRPLTPPAR